MEETSRHSGEEIGLERAEDAEGRAEVKLHIQRVEAGREPRPEEADESSRMADRAGRQEPAVHSLGWPSADKAVRQQRLRKAADKKAAPAQREPEAIVPVFSVSPISCHNVP